MTSALDNLLSKLDKVKKTGPDRYMACCPAHDDKHPSFYIRDLADGRILIKCQAGCSAEEVLDAIGLTFSDLYPPKAIDNHAKPERRPFPAADVLRAIGYEALVVSAAAVTMLSGESFTQVDRDRLMVAAGRIQAGLTAAGVQRG